MGMGDMWGMTVRIWRLLAVAMLCGSAGLHCGKLGGITIATYRGGTIAALSESRSVYAQDSLPIKTLRVSIQSGGATLAEVHADTDATDAVDTEAIVTLAEDGYTFPDGSTSVTGRLRMRGRTARLFTQKSYRLQIDSTTNLWRETRTLQLNKHPSDLTHLRNKLSFDLMAQTDHLTSLRTQFVHLFIDGVDMGLYTNIERCDKTFLAAHGLDPEGHLYQAEEFEFTDASGILIDVVESGYDEAKFEAVLQIRGERNDHRKLVSMLTDVNDLSRDINTVINEHFDRNNYLTWLAINILLDNDDTNTQNFFLYSPSTSNGWYILPWDYDDAWGKQAQPNNLAKGNTRRWAEGVSNWWFVALHKRFLQDATNVADLQAMVESLRSSIYTEAKATELLTAYRALTTPIATVSPDLESLDAVATATAEIIAEYEAEIDRLPSTIETNYVQFIAALQRPMPVFLAAPTVADGKQTFAWDASYDLQGDSITYDFEVSTDRAFGDGTIVTSSTGLTDTTITIDTLASGTYYYRVIIRDSADPANNFQSAFDIIFDGDTEYVGVRAFTI